MISSGDVPSVQTNLMCIPVALPYLVKSMYRIATWKSKSVRHYVGNTCPHVGWLITSIYSRLQDLQCAG